MKRILLCSFILSMSLSLFVGCDQSCIINSDVVVEDGIKYYLQTDKYVYKIGSKVKILFRITNKSDTARLIGDWPNLGSLQPVDIVQGDTGVWRVPATPYAETEFYLDPNESCEYAMDWEMETWPEIEIVEPGIYTVIGELGEGSIAVSVNILIVNSLENICKEACDAELETCLKKCEDWDPNGDVWLCYDNCVFPHYDCIDKCELNK